MIISAIIDTGTALITGPHDMIQTINRAIGAVFVGPEWVVVCRNIPTMPTIIFQLDGISYKFAPTDYVLTTEQDGQTTCISAFVGIDIITIPPKWVLGAAFVSNYYTAFDFDNNRVGFAQLKTSQ